MRSSREPHSDDRLMLATRLAAIVIAVGFPASALLFLLSYGVADRKIAAAVALTVGLVALHLDHVRHGFRDEVPPHGRLTFAAMVAIMVAGEVIIGPTWTLLSASLVASALLVFRPPWSIAWALGILVVCFGIGYPSIGQDGPFVAMVVAFRSVSLFTLVWFVAGVRRLESARAQLTDRAVERERERVDRELLGNLAVQLEHIEARARRAEAAHMAGDAVRVRSELAGMTDSARSTLAEARSAVAGLRDGGSRDDLQAAARLLSTAKFDA